MKTCPARFPVYLTGAGWSPEPLPGSTAGWLTCILEEGHEGPHCSPAPSSPIASHLAWEFVAGEYQIGTGDLLGELPPAEHPNCKCSIGYPLEPRLPTFDPTERIPAWWVAQNLEELIGPTPGEIFHAIDL